MRYYVLDGQGNQYGPVDVPTLNQWVRDGRIMPSTQILVEATGKVISAQMVPGLKLDMAPGLGLNPAGPLNSDPNRPMGFPGSSPQAPMTGYPRASGAFGGVGDAIPGAMEFNRSITATGLSLVCCFTVSPLGIPLAIAGIYFARRAQMMGHPGPQVAFIAAIISLVLCGINTLSLIAGLGILSGLSGAG